MAGKGGLVLAIFGPTASGKSAVAEAIAERTPAEIVSADAMQAYRGCRSLKNHPEPPTRLVGIWPLDHEGSVAEYADLAHAAIDEILAEGRTPIVAGGTGLYLRAALVELGVPPAPPPGARERWEKLYDESGADAAHEALAAADPEAAAAVHPNDRRRVVRALELAEAGSSLRPAADRLWTEETRHPTLVVGLDVPADEVARRIAERTRRDGRSAGRQRRRAALWQAPLDHRAQRDRARGVRALPTDRRSTRFARRTRSTLPTSARAPPHPLRC